jgi:hypothetical protein
MKTITEIADVMKAAFVANATLAEKYGLAVGKTFDEQFAASSLEAHIIQVMATSVAFVIWQRESYEEDIRNLILQIFIGTVPWYGALVKAFEYNGQNIIKYVSIVEQFPYLMFKVNTEDFGVIGAESDEMVALKSYIHENKVAGTYIIIESRQPDDVLPTLTVVIDAQKYNSQGQLLSDGSSPVEEAIDAYLEGVQYDGTIYKTKLVDAVQAVEGVLDVSLTGLTVERERGEIVTVTGMNYSSYGGGLISTVKNITYVLN